MSDEGKLVYARRIVREALLDYGHSSPEHVAALAESLRIKLAIIEQRAKRR